VILAALRRDRRAPTRTLFAVAAPDSVGWSVSCRPARPLYVGRNSYPLALTRRRSKAFEGVHSKDCVRRRELLCSICWCSSLLEVKRLNAFARSVRRRLLESVGASLSYFLSTGSRCFVALRGAQETDGWLRSCKCGN